jgi:DNA-binding transcriptional MerR regulator
MEKYFSIGETAQINNISIQALRLYDRMGLLKPGFIDPDSNYRYYTMNQFVYIDLIKYARYIGFPLKDLKSVLFNEDICVVQTFIEKQRSSIQLEISRLERVMTSIDNLDSKIYYTQQFRNTGEIYFRKIKQRHITKIKFFEKYSEKDKIIKLREITSTLEKSGILYEGEYGRVIDSNNLFQDHAFVDMYPYITLFIENNKWIDRARQHIDTIPEGEFICISYSKETKDEAIKKLCTYVENSPLKIGHFALETDLYCTPKQYENDQLIYELQLLLK